MIRHTVVGDSETGRRNSRGIAALEKATEGWKVEDVPTLRNSLQMPFMCDMVAMRAEGYIPDVVTRLK